jgi:hypothetical protein
MVEPKIKRRQIVKTISREPIRFENSGNDITGGDLLRTNTGMAPLPEGEAKTDDPHKDKGGNHRIRWNYVKNPFQKNITHYKDREAPDQTTSRFSKATPATFCSHPWQRLIVRNHLH